MENQRVNAITVTLLLAASLLTTSLAPIGGASDHAPSPWLASAEDLGVGWIALSFETDGAIPNGQIWVEDTTRPLQVGQAVYDEGGELVTWSAFQTFGGDGASVEGEVLGPENGVDAYEPIGWDRFGLHLLFQDREPGRYQHVIWWAAEGTWNYTLDADPGITLLGQTSGENAFVTDGKAFEGAALNAQAWDQHRGAQVVVDGERTVDVDGTLLVSWSSRLAGPTLMTLEGPGVQESCPCTRLDTTGADTLGPATYTLSFTGAGNGDTVAGGADVVLPGFPG